MKERVDVDDEVVAGLVARARNGDTHAWSQLYDRYREPIYRWLCYRLGEASAAEDLTQETFVQAVLALRRFDDRASFSTWLHAIAINQARNFYRYCDVRKRGRQSLADSEALRGNDDEGSALRQAQTDAFYAALAKIGGDLREALIQCEIEGLSAREAAARVGVTEGTLRTRLCRARKRIKEELTRAGWLKPAISKVSAEERLIQRLGRACEEAGT